MFLVAIAGLLLTIIARSISVIAVVWLTSDIWFLADGVRSICSLLRSMSCSAPELELCYMCMIYEDDRKGFGYSMVVTLKHGLRCLKQRKTTRVWVICVWRNRKTAQEHNL